MDVVVDFAELGLGSKLNLVSENVASGRGPVRRQTVVARDPFGTDISVDLDIVRIAIVGSRRDCVVRERERLFDEVRRLNRAQEVDGEIDRAGSEYKCALGR